MNLVEDEAAVQLAGVVFREFRPEVDSLAFGNLPAQRPTPLVLLLLVLQTKCCALKAVKLQM